jgi:hypothetical protein
MSRAPFSRAALRTAAALALAGALACHRLPPDPDGRPAGAQTLALGTTQTDSLECDSGDCADWFAVEMPEKSTLVLELGAEAASSPDVEVEMILYDSKGVALGSEKSGGHSSIVLRSELAPAVYYVAVGSQASGIAIPYTLTARNELPPKPKVVEKQPKPPVKPLVKAPTVETKRGSVLEIQDQGRSVLLDIGKSQGIRVGQKGRLLKGGAAAGSLVIVEVYPEGSLASVAGGKADASSTAEIDVPLAPPAK